MAMVIEWKLASSDKTVTARVQDSSIKFEFVSFSLCLKLENNVSQRRAASAFSEEEKEKRKPKFFRYYFPYLIL